MSAPGWTLVGFIAVLGFALVVVFNAIHPKDAVVRGPGEDLNSYLHRACVAGESTACGWPNEGDK